MREGTFFWAFVNIPPPDGEHAYTAVVTDAQGQARSATVTFWRDTMAPVVVITAPANDAAINTSSLTITGTVDDPEATSVRLNFSTRFPVVDGQFVVTTPLLAFDGVSFFSISAQDLSGNTGSSTIRIIRDRTPPTLTTTTPAEGAAVNTPTVTVAGTVVDRTFGVPVTVAVNGHPPTSVTTIGVNYSGTVTLDAGLNTLEVVATDEAGNVSRVTRSVLLDIVPPTVQLTAPAAGASLTGLVPVTADATDDASGLVQVRLLVDGQPSSTQTTAPYHFVLDTLQVAAGSRTLTVQAMDRAVNTADAAITVEIPPQLRLQITSPTNGSTVLYSPILVQGTMVNNYGPSEIGLTVNGYVAETQGGKFAVDGVALAAGANTLTATATDGAGVTTTATASLTVVSDQYGPPVTLTAESSNSLAPVTVTFNADAAVPSPIISYRVDFEGDGVVDSVSSTWNGLTHAYASPGLYIPNLTVIDALGQAFTAKAVVNVLNAMTVDTLLPGKWAAMKTALANNDVATALQEIALTGRDGYGELFAALTSQFSQIDLILPGITFVSIADGRAEYQMIRVDNGVRLSHFVLFVKDNDGIWRLKFF
jgi:hypothetical protein